ncbi:DoxX family protein [Pseudarthrobacter phenanthrenivorans]|uniref:DoxX family protein n=1 Tax=Pseudarthrobacter phenanthrenivorans TaxID=361575 RepID=UPI002F3516E7
MAALLVASAGKHFRDPAFYRDVVPGYLCRRDPEPGTDQGDKGRPAHPLAVLSRDEWIAVSGLLELAAAVGILLPPTRKLTATALTAMFTAFVAGHVDALVRAYGPAGTPLRRKIHTARLPLQAPLILWAWRLRKSALRKRAPGSRP